MTLNADYIDEYLDYKPTSPNPNFPLMRKVFEHIDAHPDQWEQQTYGIQTEFSGCGTAFCVAGHIANFDPEVTLDWEHTSSGEVQLDYVINKDGSRETVHEFATKALNLTDREAGLLFSGSNSRKDLQLIAERIAHRVGERF